MSLICIPKGINDDVLAKGKPAWFSCTDSAGKRIKPLIRCNCGSICGIELHHVHPDGRVTASFFHNNEGGSGWHVFLKLLDYDQGEFLPEK